MVSFLTLFLGLWFGTGTVEMAAEPGVARVELYVDGRLATEVGPPWQVRLDLGGEIAPHEIVAVAKDANGSRLGEARQWINRAGAESEARFVLERDRAGRATHARLVWSCPASPEPKSIAVSFDGEPIDAPDPARIRIPPYSPGVSHILLADLTFAEGIVATAVASLGGEAKEDVSRELTAFPVRLAGERKEVPAPARLRGWFEVGGRTLSVAAVEEGTAEVVFVPAGLALEELERLGGGDRWPYPWPRPRPIALEKRTRFRFLSPSPGPAAAAGGATRVYPVSEDYTPLDGPFLRATRNVSFPASPMLPRVAEAVAVSGLSATARERRRAVVLLLGRGALDSSDFDAARARRYLARLRVPLHVWRLVPAEAPVVDGWSDAVDASTIEGLGNAFHALRQDLAAQRVVWLEGRVDPSRVEITPRAAGIVSAR